MICMSRRTSRRANRWYAWEQLLGTMSTNTIPCKTNIAKLTFQVWTKHQAMSDFVKLKQTKRDFNQICQEIMVWFLLKWPEATLAIKLVTDLSGSDEKGWAAVSDLCLVWFPLTLWSWRSYVKHFINWSGWVKAVSSTSQPLGVRWHGITSHFIQIGQSLVSLGFRWGCMDPYYLEYLEAGARDILSKPCVPILYDPITRQFEAWLDTPEADVWNSEDKVESFRLSSVWGDEPAQCGANQRCFFCIFILKGKVPRFPC